MEIYNGTSHTITLYNIGDTEFNATTRKLILKPGAQPVATIPAGTNLNCVKDNLPAPDFTIDGISLKGAVAFTGYDPLPEDAQGKVVVVSNLYRSAVKELGGDTSLLATVDGAVYESVDNPRPCGCLGLAVG